MSVKHKLAASQISQLTEKQRKKEKTERSTKKQQDKEIDKKKMRENTRDSGLQPEVFCWFEISNLSKKPQQTVKTDQSIFSRSHYERSKRMEKGSKLIE